MTKIKNRYLPKKIRIRSYKLVKALSSIFFFLFLLFKSTIFMAKVKKNRYLPNENQDMAIKISQNPVQSLLSFTYTSPVIKKILSALKKKPL